MARYRARKGGPDLAQLLAQRATSLVLEDAADAIRNSTGAAPWVVATGVSVVLLRFSYDLLLDSSGASIGLYRNSSPAREQFGIGRHPADGLLHGRTHSFVLVVEPLQTGLAGEHRGIALVQGLGATQGARSAALASWVSRYSVTSTTLPPAIR